MEEKKTSGIRKDLSPSEFQARMDKVASRKKESKVKSFFGKFSEILCALGLLPTLNQSTNSIGHRGHRGHGDSGGTYQSSNQGFRDTYRVEPPPPRTHEQWLIDEMAHEAYEKLVDGKGDHDCGHEH